MRGDITGWGGQVSSCVDERSHIEREAREVLPLPQHKESSILPYSTYCLVDSRQSSSIACIMTAHHRVATGVCRRLGQNQPLLRCRTSTSTKSTTLLQQSRSQKITTAPLSTTYNKSRNRHATKAIVQIRNFHQTSNTLDEAPASAATTTGVSSKTGEPIAPFASPKVEALFQKIIWLDMVEVHLLAELINEKMGITISDAERERMARGGGGGGRGGSKSEDDAPAEAIVERTVFDLKLLGFDAKNKIKVIKEVRSMTNLGLKEAKELVEGVPATLKKDIKKEEAEELKSLLEGLGAQVDIV